MKTFVMGDIHGCYKGLLQCLERSGFDKENDTLIQLGDIADGWSEVPECVEELMTIKNLIAIHGNHDYWTHNWFFTGEIDNPVWLKHGGQATIDAYAKTEYNIEKHKQFFANQEYFYIDYENRGFVHGGFTNPRGLGWETLDSHILDHSLWIDVWENNIPGVSKAHKEIFIGHTSTTFYESDKPLNAYNVWNIDTGAAFDGKLTIMDVDTKEYWQSDPVRELYPNEKGR